MALIGFRSPLTYHPWPWSEYTEEQKKMFNVRPGITGWAQVNGRKTVEWNKRIELNGWYAEHVSFWLDVKILFELLLDGTVEELCLKFRKGGIPYGFGGIASLGKGMLPSEYVIKEHYRLGSTCAILSRSFCRTDQVTDLKEIQKIFETELPKIRELEEECRVYSEYFWKNRQQVETKIRQICECEDAK